MISSLRHTLHLLRIGFTLARYNALFGLNAVGAPRWLISLCYILARRDMQGREGERLAKALEKLGPTYIKIGQLLSTRADLIGEEIAHDLSYLRDSLPPFSAKKARAIIEAELDKSIDTIFSEFDDTPIAAASIAQVHFATTTNGDDVAVKILRPGIHEQFERDIELMEWLAHQAHKRLPHLKRLHPQEVVRTFVESMRMELDLLFEAAAAVELRENLIRDKELYIPRIDWQRTSGNVMTLERIEGIAISDVAALKEAGHDLQKLVEQAAVGFFNQVFRDGFFHADLHPGNLFVMKDGRIAAVDFGIMGRLDMDNRLFLADVLWGFLREDYYHVAKVHFDRAIVPPHYSVENFAQACRAIGRPIMDKPLDEISVAKLLGQLFNVAQQFEMELQPQLLLLQKTMMLSEGVGRMLMPDINMWRMAEPMIEAWGKANLGAKARLKHTAEEGISMLQKLPAILREAEHTFREINEGGLKLHPDTINHYMQQQPSRSGWLRLGWASVIMLGVVLVIEALG